MKWYAWLGVIALVLTSVCFTSYIYLTFRTVSLERTVTVTIPDLSGTEGAMTELYNAGVIQSRAAFIAYITLTGQRSNIRAGSYDFSGDQSIASVVSIITRQKQTAPEVEVTLLEGWDNATMASYLNDNNVMTAAAFNESATTTTAQYDWLQQIPAEANLQGFLFPDTYRLFVGGAGSDLIEKMLANFDQKFTPTMRADLVAQNHTIYEVVTLASIVEKEVRTPTDKKIVAGIFWKRIANGQRLQSDVTILYAMSHSTPPLEQFDTNLESAYNTYRVNGLPPTPICNPGLDSLEAVVYPTDTEYNYFLTTKQGEVIYSKTYEEHLAAKNQYLQ